MGRHPGLGVIRRVVFNVRLMRALLRESRRQMPNATWRQRLFVVVYSMQKFSERERLDREALRQEYR